LADYYYSFAKSDHIGKFNIAFLNESTFYSTTYNEQLVFISKIATGVCIMKKMKFHIQDVL